MSLLFKKAGQIMFVRHSEVQQGMTVSCLKLTSLWRQSTEFCIPFFTQIIYNSPTPPACGDEIKGWQVRGRMDNSYPLRKAWEQIKSQGVEITRGQNAVLEWNLKKNRMICVCFQGSPLTITVIQVCAPTSNAKEAEVEWFCEDLQDLLELTPRKDVLFIIGDWNAKVGSQEIPGVTGKFGLGVQNEAG